MNAEIKEKEVPGYPGWKKLQLGGSRTYVSPGGAELSARQFMKLSSEYGSNIPETAVTRIKTSSPRGFFPSTPQGPQPHKKETADQKSDQEVPINLPEPKSHYTKPKSGRATSSEIASGLYITLAIVTSVAAHLFNRNELSMTETEAKSIAVPLGNLLEPTKLNEYFGQMIASSGDWQLLGYALWSYASRVMAATKERNDIAKSQRPVTAASGPNAAGAAPTNGYRPGASLPYSSKGVSWTPPTA